MVAPVANTITSTTSATQDLEVFKNYPSEKNNKLIQQKYGSQEEFFKKISAEGYAEGFKGQELNLPATGMLNEAAMKQFLDPQGISAYKDTPLERYAGAGELTENIPTMRSTFPEGQAIPIEEFEKYGGMDKSGVTSLGKLWNEAGGEYPAVSPDPEAHVMSQAASDEIMNQSINKGSSMPGGFSLDYPIDKGKNFAQPGGVAGMEPLSGGEDKTSIYNKRLNDGMMYSDGEMRKQGFSDDQIKRANQIEYSDTDRSIQFKEEPNNEQRRKEQSQLYGLDAIGQSTGAPETTGIKTIETKDENVASASVKKDKSQLRKEWDIIKKGGKWLLDALIEGGNLSELGWMKPKEGLSIATKEVAKGVDAIAKNYERDKERLEAVKMNSDIWLPLMEKDSGGDMSQWGLPFINPDGKTWFYDSDKKVKIFGENITIDPRVKELLKREEVMKEAEMRDTGNQNASEIALDDYILQEEKNKLNKKDEGLKVTVPIGDKYEDKIAPKADEPQDLSLINALMKKSETKTGLNKEDKTDLTENLKDQGVETKGLTDKNMLLIAMGLGMMASDKPGLQGVGAGALEGLKVALPLMKEKSSDIQMITVKNDDGNNVIVRYNKKKGTYEETGLKSGTTSTNATLQKIQTLSNKANIPEDVVATAIVNSLTETKGKPRETRIENMVKILSLRLPNITIDDKSLIEAATNIIDDIDEGKVNFKESDVGL